MPPSREIGIGGLGAADGISTAVGRSSCSVSDARCRCQQLLRPYTDLDNPRPFVRSYPHTVATHEVHMLDQETIKAQLELLATHRQRLTLLVQQQAKLGTYTPPYVIIDIQEAQSTIRVLKERLRVEDVPVADELNDDVQPAVVALPSRLSPLEQRNRRAMLTKVKTIWINGLLDQSLAKQLRIALDLTAQPDAVLDLPLNALVQELNRLTRPLPTGTPIIKVFEQMGGALLILGAPGAGKTTLLLELGRDLITRAEQDGGHPIPIVFNLSSWATKRQPLKDWLIEELNTKYDVPRELAQAWMEVDVVLPLLDVVLVSPRLNEPTTQRCPHLGSFRRAVVACSCVKARALILEEAGPGFHKRPGSCHIGL